MSLLYRFALSNDTLALWEMLTYAARMPDDLAANIAAAQADPCLKSTWRAGASRVDTASVVMLLEMERTNDDQ